MATTTKATKPATPKARTCTWKVNGEKRCGQPTIRPSAATCRDHVEVWMEAHGRKLTAFSVMTGAEIAKAKAARPKPATKAPVTKRAAKPAARKPAAKAPATPTAPEVDPMEREIAAVKAMKERDAAKA